jgi:integrase
MGLGGLEFVPLVEAREKAFEARRQLRQGVDPLEARKAGTAKARLAALNSITFVEAARLCVAARSAEWRSNKWALEWLSTLERYAYPIIGTLPVAAIDTALVHRVLDPIWVAKPDTGERLRQRIAAVLEWSRVRGYRDEDAPNPARLSGHLKHSLPKTDKVRRVKHHAALAYRDAPAFMAQLRARPGIPARALEFAVLTAARASEARLARWSEIDLAARAWTIPGERMKGGCEHRVPLSDRVLSILGEVPRLAEHVFAGARGGPLSENAMWTVLKALRPEFTVHGLRSTFRDWAAEMTAYPNHVQEMALAHAIPTAVEKAYRRGDLFDKRARLMAEWAAYCSAAPDKPADVLPFRRETVAQA